MSKQKTPFIPGVTASGTLPGVEALAERNASGTYNLRFIHIDKILPNEVNQRYQQLDLQSLATSIMDQGLLHNLVTTDFDETGCVKLISGERRWRACNIIREQDPKRFLELFPNELLPCKIQEDISDIDAEIELITANHAVRTLDAKERLIDVRRLAELYREREQVSGERLSEQIANALGLSERQIYKLLSLDMLIPRLATAFEDNILSINTASKIAKFGETEQLFLADILQEEGTITEEDIESARQIKAAKEQAEQKLAQAEDKIHTLESLQISARTEKERNLATAQINKVKEEQSNLKTSLSRAELKRIRLVTKSDKLLNRLFQDLEKLEKIATNAKEIPEVSVRLDMLKIRLEEIANQLS